jgi:hypothetical protein
MIETQSRSCGGWFLREPFVNARLWNHPSRDTLRDPAALLTQEGNILASYLFHISNFAYR